MNIEQVLNLYSKPTQFELKRNIKIGDWELFRDYGDIKFFINRKSDDTVSLLMIFRAGKTDNWCGWMPSEEQFKVLINHFPSIIEKIEDYNMMRCKR